MDHNNPDPTRFGPIAFGKYLLLERVAIGGMAEIFLARTWDTHGSPYDLVIKKITPSRSKDPNFIQMFIDEAQIAGQLCHPGIAAVYEVGKIGDIHYIGMEYVWGQDLFSMIERNRIMGQRMPAPRAAYIAARMCEALDYAHHLTNTEGRPLELIHRDISPQNILISYEGAVKIIDFGIAKAQTRTTQTVAGHVKGKFAYMSPEQILGKRLDARSDIFSIGICLFEMLASQQLFAAESDFETMDRVRYVKIPDLTKVLRDTPTELIEILLKALSSDPKDRFQTAIDMYEALVIWLLTQNPPMTPSRLSEWMHIAFEDEILEEKSRFQRFQHLTQEHVEESEATMIFYRDVDPEEAVTLPGTSRSPFVHHQIEIQKHPHQTLTVLRWQKWIFYLIFVIVMLVAGYFLADTFIMRRTGL